MDPHVEQSFRTIVQDEFKKVLVDAVTGKDPEVHSAIRKMLIEIIERRMRRRRLKSRKGLHWRRRENRNGVTCK